jgi:prepilin-type N-terminal cleavage/methylation domain-containing protein
MFRSAPVRAARGVTLVELMVALVVAAILLAIAVPSFRHLIGSSNLGSVANDLASDIAFARTESAMRHVKVAVTSSTAGWDAGWKVEIPSSSTAAEVLRNHAPIPTTYAIAASASSVSYQPDGSLATAPANGVCLTIKAPADTNNKSTYVQVFASGTVQQASSATVPSGWACP